MFQELMLASEWNNADDALPVLNCAVEQWFRTENNTLPWRVHKSNNHHPGAQSFLRSQQSLSSSTISVYFMKPESLLSCHKNLGLFLFLNRRNAVHTLIPYFFKIHNNIILKPRIWLTKWSVLSRYSNQNSVCISERHHALYMNHPSHVP